MLKKKIQKIAEESLPHQVYPLVEAFGKKLIEVKWNFLGIKRLNSQIELDEPIIMYCVGARYGLPHLADYLRRKKKLFSIGFEPDPAEAKRLKDNDKFDVIVSKALGSEHGVRTLNITKHPGCSSLLFPNTENLKKFFKYPDWFDVKETMKVELHRLDEIVKKEALPVPDFLQIDTQGFDFEVLLGGAKILNHISVVELEVHMYPIYKEQKTFIDIHHFMIENGFVLFLLVKHGHFGINYVEGNACYFNQSLINKSKKINFLIDYCSNRYGVNLEN